MPPRRGRKGGATGSPVETKRHERAWRAVKAFSEMRPAFTAFARTVTGDRSVTVEMSRGGTRGQSQTDGRRIHLQPPIALGDQLAHEQGLCDRRDSDTLVKLCKACATRELLVARLFHEIAHIAFQSNNKIYAHERKQIAAMINEWHPHGVCPHGADMHARLARATNHLDLAAAFHPYLMHILKSYEDARIDVKMYRARPGLKIPTEARMRFTFAKGIESEDDSWLRWIDAPKEAQTFIGLLLMGIGYDIREDYLAPDVIESLSDPELNLISSEISTANSVNNAFDISVRAFRRLQEMSLCPVLKCEPTSPPPPSLNKEPNDQSKSSEQKDDDSKDGDDGNSDNKEKSDDDKSSDRDESQLGSAGGDGGSEQKCSDGTPSESPGNGDDSGRMSDATDGEGPGSRSDDGETGKEEEASSGSGGDRQSSEDSDSQPESHDRDLSSEDDRRGPSEQSHPRREESDDPTGPDGHDNGRNPEEQNAGDEDGKPDRHGQGADCPDSPEVDSEEPSSCDSSDGQPGVEESGGESRENPGDRNPEATDPLGDVEADDSPDSRQDLENDGGSGDDSDLEDAEGDLSEAEALAPLKGERVWEEDNPEWLPEDFSADVNDGLSDPLPPLTAEEIEALLGKVEALLDKFMGHGHEDRIDAALLGLGEPGSDPEEEDADRRAVGTAMVQSGVFDTSSIRVRGALDIEYPHPPFNWPRRNAYPSDPQEFMPSESVIGKALLAARITFSANKLAKTQGNLRSGKINPRVLGRRAALADDRLFKKRKLPGKRDYFVVMSGDCSGSTNSGYRNERIKRALFAKAELLSRLGVPFAIYGHTGGAGDPSRGIYFEHPSGDDMTELWMLQVKKPSEPWNSTTMHRLAEMPPLAENLDGHTLEYLRRVAEKSSATARIIIYYTDGAMPASNYDEELQILTEEIDKCKRSGITLMAVGINTDSPERFGFDTVQVDSDEDLVKVVDRLRDRLTQ